MAAAASGRLKGVVKCPSHEVLDTPLFNIAGPFGPPRELGRSLPVKSALHHPEEGSVVFLQVGPELLQDRAVDCRVRTSLGLVQAALPAVAPNAVEPLGVVEVEVGGSYPRREVEEALHLLQLRQRVADQGVPVHDMQLFQGKVEQPVAHVDVVQAPLNGLVAGVERPVAHQQVLDGLHRLVVLQSVEVNLGVVRDHPLGRVSQDQKELYGGVHGVDAFWGRRRGEVTGCFLHRDLVWVRVGHELSVPLQALGVVLIPVEKVHLGGGGGDLGVDVQHLQERPCAALSNPDDDTVRRSFTRSWGRRCGDAGVKTGGGQLRRGSVGLENQKKSRGQQTSHGDGRGGGG